MKAKLYTDGFNTVGGFKKPKDMRKFWVCETVNLAKKQTKEIKEYGHTEKDGVKIFKNLTWSHVYA